MEARGVGLIGGLVSIVAVLVLLVGFAAGVGVGGSTGVGPSSEARLSASVSAVPVPPVSPQVGGYLGLLSPGLAFGPSVPQVVGFWPSAGQLAVPTNTRVVATFSEPMNASTVTTSTFTLHRGATPVVGTVAYGGVSAVFTPTAALAASTTYTAALTTGVRDLDGHPLGSAFYWSFSTGSTPDLSAPTVVRTVPVAGATGVAASAPLAVYFSEPMNPATLTTSSVLVRQGTYTVPGSVLAAGNSATFVAAYGLPLGAPIVVTVTTAATDLNGNPMSAPFSWDFTTSISLPVAIPLGSAATFAVLAGSQVTSSGVSAVVGDLGVSPGTTVNGFPPGTVSQGSIHPGDLAAAKAQGDLAAALADGMSRATGAQPLSGDIGGQVLGPGLYRSTGWLAVNSGSLVLNAHGDPTAVFIFQVPTAFTVSAGRAVVLLGGAQASNVFWLVGGSATIAPASMVSGSVLAFGSVSVGLGAHLDGRALALRGAVYLSYTTVLLPPPSLVSLAAATVPRI